jgi:hypothetical protein
LQNATWRRFTGEKRSSLLAMIEAMAETNSSATPSLPGAPHGETSDQGPLAQVEKWMSIIRELAHDRGAPTIIPSDDPSPKE